MNPIVSIIMGSTSDLPVMEKACKFLNDMQIPFEVNALSAHRTPEAVERFAKDAKGRGIQVIIAGAGMSAALHVGRTGCLVVNRADAPRHSRCYGRRKRSHECRHLGNRDNRLVECGGSHEDGSIQGWSGCKDRKGESGFIGGEV